MLDCIIYVSALAGMDTESLTLRVSMVFVKRLAFARRSSITS